MIAITAFYLLFYNSLFPVCHAGHHICQVGGREQEEVLYCGVAMTGQVKDHLVGSEGMPGKDDVLVAFFRGEGEVCIDILIGVGKAFVPDEPYTDRRNSGITANISISNLIFRRL